MRGAGREERERAREREGGGGGGGEGKRARERARRGRDKPQDTSVRWPPIAAPAGTPSLSSSRRPSPGPSRPGVEQPRRQHGRATSGVCFRGEGARGRGAPAGSAPCVPRPRLLVWILRRPARAHAQTWPMRPSDSFNVTPLARLKMHWQPVEELSEIRCTRHKHARHTRSSQVRQADTSHTQHMPPHAPATRAYAHASRRHRVTVKA